MLLKKESKKKKPSPPKKCQCANSDLNTTALSADVILMKWNQTCVKSEKDWRTSDLVDFNL